MWSKLLLNTLFPSDCLCCQYGNNAKHGFCLGCYRDLPHLRQACLRCGLPVDADHLCACKDEDWPFSACIAACRYDFPINALISQLKNAHRLSVASCLADLLIAQVQHQKLPLPDLLLPVPAHPDKLRQRGFNQSVEIAKLVGKRLNLPVDIDSLECLASTTAQKTLSRQQRHANTRSHFRLTQPISVQRVALIDDVITTGATTKALAYVLREQGVADIQAWAVARTLAHRS